jgi:hypothetical protein
MIRRLNFYSGPGTGKTTTSSDVFAKLKNRVIHGGMDIQVELVQEYIKNWAWEGRKPIGFDQVYVCAKQMRREEIPLRNGVDLIVTDSPLLMQCAYARKYNVPCWEHLVGAVEEFEKVYPSFHIFLERGDRPYVAKGRFQTTEEAKQMDEYIKGMLTLYVPSFLSISYTDTDQIVETVISQLGKKE